MRKTLLFYLAVSVGLHFATVAVGAFLLLPDTVTETLTIAAATAALPLAAFLVARPYGIDWDILIGPRLRTKAYLYILLSAAILVFGEFFFSYAFFGPMSLVAPQYVENALNSVPLNWDYDGELRRLNAAAILFTVLVLAPVCEEAAFRGFIFARWARKGSPAAAAVASSLIFAALHNSPLGAFVFSMACCGLVVRYRSVVAAIVLHAANNLLAAALWFAGPLFEEASQDVDIDAFLQTWPLALASLALLVPWALFFFRSTPPLRQWTPPWAEDLPQSAEAPTPPTHEAESPLKE